MLAIAFYLGAVVILCSVLAFDELIPAPVMYGPADYVSAVDEDETVRWSHVRTVVLRSY